MRIKIVSGGQTGADRGGLDAAIELGIEQGGWCPKGRKAEDGIIPPAYYLDQTKSSDYRVRTEANVQDSDATLIFTFGKLDGGSLLTAECATKHGKPWMHIDLAGKEPTTALHEAFDWVQLLSKESLTLNVAGQRESKAPGIHSAVRRIMISLLKRLCLKQ
jgi:hypothetical protein